MKKLLHAFLLLALCLSLTNTTIASGLLPSLQTTVGIAMPSLGEALRRYPDTDTTTDDGGVLETYNTVSETDFNTFSVYLEKIGASLSNYQVNGNVLTATINVNNAAFNITYGKDKAQMEVSYPVGTFDEWLKNAKTHHHTASELAKAGLLDEADAEWRLIPEHELYLSEEKIAAGVYEYASELVEQNRIISALKILRRVDGEKCNELHASIEGFLCSLYVPYDANPTILKPDGTVVDINGKICERNVIRINHGVPLITPKGSYGLQPALVALKSDGTVVSNVDLDYDKYAEKNNTDPYHWGTISRDKWNNIIDLKCESSVYAGLRSDGTVAAEWKFSGNELYEKQVDKWIGIKQIAVVGNMVYGLKTDGSVIEAGERYDRYSPVNSWKNITEIYSDGYVLFGRKTDGTIVINLKTNEMSWERIYKDISWSELIFSAGAGDIASQVNSDGSTKYKKLTDEDRKYHDARYEIAMEYLVEAKNCLAVSRMSDCFAVIKEDGSLVHIDTATGQSVIRELNWKLWNDEQELGKLYNQYYTQAGIQKRLNISSPQSSKTAKSKSTKPTDAPSTKKVRINRGSNPNVRKSPSADSKRIGVAKSNQVYPLIEISNNNWYRIKLEDGTTGWIAGGFAEIVK